jgi:superfamily II RNA helicase
LVPQKALAEEKYREFSRRYAKAGVDVVISSRDRREFDGQILGRQFQIAIVVYEKLQALLVAQPNLIQGIGLVVVDELQMLTDDERGPGLELLLTKLKMAGSHPRLIGLSAVLGKAALLAEWLEAKLLIDTRRPVELRKGVLCQGVFRYREHNSEREGSEEIAVPPTKYLGELLVAAADTLTRRGEQARELLRRILKDGRIVLEPQPDGVYLARTAVLPQMVLAEKQNRRFWELPEAAMSSWSSGGPLRELDIATSLEILARLVA